MGNIALFVAYVAAYSVLLPLFFLLQKTKNLKDEVLSIFTIFLLLSGVTDLVCYIINKFLNLPTSNLINIEFALECFLLSIIYARLFDRYKKVVYGALAAFLIFAFANSLFYQNINTYQSMTRI